MWKELYQNKIKKINTVINLLDPKYKILQNNVRDTGYFTCSKIYMYYNKQPNIPQVYLQQQQKSSDAKNKFYEKGVSDLKLSFLKGL